MEQERVRGRRRYSEAERREYVRLFREGELTQSAFADRHGIKVCTLRRWIYQDRDRMAGSGDAGRFREISLSVPGLGMSGTVDILLGDGITVRLGEAGVRSPWGVWNPDFGNCFELSFRYGERQVVESVSVLRPDIEKTSGLADWRGLRDEIFCN